MIEGKTYPVTAREHDQNKSTKREKREKEHNMKTMGIAGHGR